MNTPRLKPGACACTGLSRDTCRLSDTIGSHDEGPFSHAPSGIHVGVLGVATGHAAERRLGLMCISPARGNLLSLGRRSPRQCWNAKKRRRLGKALARKQGPSPDEAPSKNFLKAKRRLARLEARIADIRIDATHEATTDLCRTCSHLVLEDLSVQGMPANHKLANSLADVGLSEFRRQVEYKAKRYACTVTFAPRFFPSSKMCSKYVHILMTISSCRIESGRARLATPSTTAT
jgi:putative transposase